MSDAMKALQARCGAVADGAFGPNTARAIAKHFDLTPHRAAHLLGQAHHESGGFKRTKESLYYSTPERICAVWPTRFATPKDAEPYAKNPEGLAGKVYVREELGNETEADAIAHIGRGFIQLTGKANYSAFARDMRLPQVMQDPSLVETEYAFESAFWFFRSNGLFEIADAGVSDKVIRMITRGVNGGTHGLTDRTKQTLTISNWLRA
jgi:putative chitinase